MNDRGEQNPENRSWRSHDHARVVYSLIIHVKVVVADTDETYGASKAAAAENNMFDNVDSSNTANNRNTVILIIGSRGP